MSKTIKSGKEVIEEFFLGAMAIENTDKTIVQCLIDLHNAENLTDASIQLSLDGMLQAEIDSHGKGHNEN